MYFRFFAMLAFLLHNIKTEAQPNLSNQWGVGFKKQIIAFNPKPSFTEIGNEIKAIFFLITGISSICDTSGKFLMITDGMMVYNAKGDTIKNGGGHLNNICYPKQYGNHNLVPNNTIIIPKKENQYYIFYTTMSDSKCEHYYSFVTPDTFDFDELRYSIVDMNANNGAGEIKELNKLALSVPSPWLGKASITATKHANGRDWWVVKSSARERQFKYIFLVTPDTIIEHTQDMGLAFNTFAYDNYGQNNFSMDGSLYAECAGNSPITIYNFDRCSGMFSLKRVIEPTPYKDQTFDKYSDWSGVCFSPNNKYLYTCDQHHVYQLNVAEPNDALATLKVSELDTSSNFPKYSGLQITPTGVLYIGHWNGVSKDINAIMQPNEYGLASAFKFDYIRLLSNTNDPPNIPNYGLGALVGSPCDTIRLKPNEWLLYPNPANAVIKLKVPNSIKGEVVQVGLYDMLGKLALMQERIVDLDHEINIDTRNFANGLYILKALHQQSKFVSKFVKE
jgi:Secretion system C-terminal sorting domain